MTRNTGYKGQVNSLDKANYLGSDFAQKKSGQDNAMAMIALKKKEKNLQHNLKM